MEDCGLDDKAQKNLEYFKEQLRQRSAPANAVNTCAHSLLLYTSLYGDLSLESLNGYRKYLIAHYKPATANSRIYGMNQYLKLPAGYRMAEVKMQHRPFLDNVISQRDYERLKVGLRKDNNIFWYFVVHFLWSTGARISELLQIKAEHIRMGYMDLYSKGGKVRRVYFPETLCRDALSWLGTRNLQTGFVFTNHSNAPFTAHGISPAAEGPGKTLPDTPGHRLPLTPSATALPGIFCPVLTTSPSWRISWGTTASRPSRFI